MSGRHDHDDTFHFKDKRDGFQSDGYFLRLKKSSDRQNKKSANEQSEDFQKAYGDMQAVWNEYLKVFLDIDMAVKEVPKESSIATAKVLCRSAIIIRHLNPCKKF